MITQALFLSAKQAQALEPRADTAVISILDRSEEAHRPIHLASFKEHLVLQFLDTYERLAADQSVRKHGWPDQMTPAQHREACGEPDERAPELSDAKAIVDFIDRHLVSLEETRLVIHCYAGMSRSAAVADFVASVHGVPLPQCDDSMKTTDGANPRLLRLLRKAAGHPQIRCPRNASRGTHFHP